MFGERGIPCECPRSFIPSLQNSRQPFTRNIVSTPCVYQSMAPTRQLRRKTRAAVFTVLALACACGAHAQSADKILKNYVKAIGGEKNLKKIKNVAATGDARDDAAGQSGSFTLETRAPDSFYLEMTGDGLTRSEGFNGSSGWEQNAGGAPSTLTGGRSAQLRATAFYWNDHFQTYSKVGVQAALAAQETIDGNAANVVEMTTRAGVHRKFFFDAKSGMLIKETEEGEGAEEETIFSDFRPVDGVLEPFHLVIHSEGRTIVVTMREVRHNTKLSEGVFAFPEKATAPLPDPGELVREVEKNQKQLDLLRKNYTYTMDETELATDNKGKTQNKDAKTYEVFYLGDEEVNRVVAKDGKPLSDPEKKKEDERIDKIYKKYEEKKKKDAAAADTLKKDKEEDDGDVGIKDFLRASQFVNPRRERFRGQEMIVFDFQPRTDYKPKNLNERLIQTLSGVIWIDENAKEVVRLEARTNDNFKIGGGLVISLQQGMYFAFEQEFIRGEVWLPSYAEIHLSARAFLFVHFKGDVVDRFSNYKKFGSDIQIQRAPQEKH